MGQLLERAAKKFIEAVRDKYTITFKRQEVTATLRPGTETIFDCQAKNANQVEARGWVKFDKPFFTVINIEHFNDPRTLFIPYCEICEGGEKI